MPRSVRVQRHRRAAEWLETLGRLDDHADLIAHHYLTALDVAKAAAAEPLDLPDLARTAARRAGDRALNLGAFEAARGYYGRALELWPDDDTRPYLLLRYGRASYQYDLGGGDELREASERLLALGDAASAAEAETICGEIEWQRGEHDRAFTHFDRAGSLFEDAAPSPAKASFLSALARYRLLAGEDDALELAREALELGDLLGIESVRAQSRITIGTARGLDGDWGGVADLEAGIVIGEAANSVEAARGHTNLGSVLERMGDSARARDHFSRARATAERFGQGHGVRWADGNLIGYLYAGGSWEEALDVAERWLRDEEAGPHYQDSTMLAIRGRIRLARDDIDGARGDFDVVLERARVTKDPQVLVPALIVAAWFSLSTGDRRHATDLVAEAGGVEGLAGWADRLGAWAEMGEPFLRVARALDFEEKLLAAAQARPATSYWYEVALTFLRGDYADAARGYAAGERYVDEAMVRVDFARALVTEGRRNEADGELERALTFYRSVGARRHIREAESLLAASA